MIPCSTDVSLRVTVLEQDCPRFEYLDYSMEVPENISPHSLMPLKVVAQAPFGHPVLYHLVEDQDSPFAIDVTNGQWRYDNEKRKKPLN